MFACSVRRDTSRTPGAAAGAPGPESRGGCRDGVAENAPERLPDEIHDRVMVNVARHGDHQVLRAVTRRVVLGDLLPG